jgi:sortase A
MSRPSRGRRRLEKFLLVVGLVAVAIWIGSIVRTAVSQDWANWAFERRLHSEPATVDEYVKSWFNPRHATELPSEAPLGEDHPPVPPDKPSVKTPGRVIATGEMIGRLEIPRLKLHAIVREGAGAGTLALALGHIPGTAFPGQPGNVGVAGHRDALFRGLGQIRQTDRIEFQTLAGKYEYEVESTEIVKPQKVSVLNAGQYPEITLVTCYPFYYVGSAPDRFIVKARLVSESGSKNASLVAAKSAPESRPLNRASNPLQSAPQDKPETAPAVEPVKPERVVERRAVQPAIQSAVQHSPRKIFFQVSEGHSRTLAPGISLGLDWTDPGTQRMNGWMWVMPDRRTIRLKRQHTRDPLVFYGGPDGRRRQLVITTIGRNSVSGYLQLGG